MLAEIVQLIGHALLRERGTALISIEAPRGATDRDFGPLIIFYKKAAYLGGIEDASKEAGAVHIRVLALQSCSQHGYHVFDCHFDVPWRVVRRVTIRNPVQPGRRLVRAEIPSRSLRSANWPSNLFS